MKRAFALIAVLALAPAAPAGAKSGNGSLLSGYGAPGDGEQALIGQQLIVAPRSKSHGTARTPVAPVAATPSPTAIYAAPTAPAPAAKARHHAAPRPHRRAAARPADAATVVAPARPAAAAAQPPAIVIAPASAPAPLGGADIGAVAALLAVLLLVAGSARRLVARTDRAAGDVTQ